jgi:hypothetical protein
LLGLELTGVCRDECSTARLDGEEAGLDGDERKRLRRDSFTNSRRQLAPQRPNAAAPSASSTSPTGLATSNESEREGEKLSGR